MHEVWWNVLVGADISIGSSRRRNYNPTLDARIIFCRSSADTMAGRALRGISIVDVVPPAAAALVPERKPGKLKTISYYGLS